MTESRKKLRLMAHRDTRICRNLLKWQDFSIFISLRLTFISLCGGFISLRLAFISLRWAFHSLSPAPDYRPRRKKVQFLAPNPLKTLRRLQKRRALLVMTIPSKRDVL